MVSYDNEMEWNDMIPVISPATVTHLSGRLVSLDFCEICTYAPLSSFICLIKFPAFPIIIPAVLLGTRILTC